MPIVAKKTGRRVETSPRTPKIGKSDCIAIIAEILESEVIELVVPMSEMPKPEVIDLALVEVFPKVDS